MKKIAFTLFCGGGFLAGSLPKYARKLPDCGGMKMISVHATYDSGGCSEWVKAAYHDVHGRGFSPGDLLTGLVFPDALPAENPFDPGLYNATMALDLCMNPMERFIIPPNGTLSDIVKKRLNEVKNLPRHREPLALALTEMAASIDKDTELTIALKNMHTHKTSLGNLLVLHLCYKHGWNLKNAMQELNYLLNDVEGTLAIPIGIEDCELSAQLVDGNRIYGHHGIVCEASAYTSPIACIELKTTASGMTPSPNPDVLDAIKDTQLAYVLGGGSPFDSALVHLLTGDIARLLAEQVSGGKRFVYLVKPMVELQISDLSVKDIFLIYEKSLHKLEPDLHIQDIITDVALPVIPQELLDEFINQVRLSFRGLLNIDGLTALDGARSNFREINRIMRDNTLMSEDTLYKIATGEIKPAKLSDCLPMPVTMEDKEFLAERGIRLHSLNSFGIWEGSIQYHPGAIIDFLSGLFGGSTLIDNRKLVDNQLAKTKYGTLMRIEWRVELPGGIGQVALIGKTGEERVAMAEELQTLFPDLSVMSTGKMTIGIQKRNVDKTLPISYVYRKKSALFPHAVSNATLRICDGDGTLYGAPTATEMPGLDMSPFRETVLLWLETGDLLLVNTSNDLYTTVERLTRNNALPIRYYPQILVAACSGAILARFVGSERKIVCDDEYIRWARYIRGLTPSLDPQFKCIYYGDNPSPTGEDWLAFEYVGRKNSVLVPRHVIGLRQAFMDSLKTIPVSSGPFMIKTISNGQCVCIDFGGTFLRCHLVEFLPNSTPVTLQSIDMRFTPGQKDCTHTDIFAITACFLKNLESDSNRKYPVGISFSQPFTTPDLDNPRDIRMTMSAKGWNLDRFIDQNLYVLFQQAIDSAGLSNLDLRFIANDIACAHLACPEADFAVIVGIGFGFSYKGTDQRIHVVEAGEFMSPEMDLTDYDMYYHSTPFEKRACEKMISGKYIWQNIQLACQGKDKIAITHDRIRRAGRHIGAILGAIADRDGHSEKINIVADGTLIRKLSDMRDAITDELSPYKTVWNVMENAPLIGCGLAALTN